MNGGTITGNTNTYSGTDSYRTAGVISYDTGSVRSAISLNGVSITNNTGGLGDLCVFAVERTQYAHKTV